VRFGIQTPQYATDLPALAALWQAAERLGFRSAWLMDHLYPILAPPTAPILEAWTALTALAVATTRLRVGVLVTANTFRHPAVLARMAATLDHVAGGRLEVGLGAAWCREEHEEQGIPFPSLGERLTRLDEACTVLRRLWTEPAVTFAGRHYPLTNARCAPKPAQARLPLLVAGQGERRALRIVARHADRWNASGAADTLAAKAAILRAHAAEIGRPAAAIALTVRNDFQLTADPAVARATRERFAAFTQTTADEARRRLFVGDRREVTDLVGGFAAAGFEECILALAPPYGGATAEMLAEFAAEIAPVFGGP
jgi:F420-dependent oxidoreductase-like protein